MAEPARAPNPIRAATQRDAPELARLFTELGHPTSATAVAERWSHWAAAGNLALVAAAGNGDALTGAVTLHQMLVLHRTKPVGRITALVVDASVRGRGIGRALVAAAEELLAGSGCGMLEITSSARFGPAHAFYEHLGYERTSVRFAKPLVPAGLRGR